MLKVFENWFERASVLSVVTIQRKWPEKCAIHNNKYDFPLLFVICALFILFALIPHRFRIN